MGMFVSRHDRRQSGRTQTARRLREYAACERGVPVQCDDRADMDAMEPRNQPTAENHGTVEPRRPAPDDTRTCPTKPTLAALSGVKPSDRPTERDMPKRDRPRISFKPFHAVIAILTLTCALCASLTMLLQQAVNYSALQREQTMQTQSTSEQPRSSQSNEPQTQRQSEQATQTDSEGQNGQPVAPAETESNKLDLNAVGSEELQTIKGIGPVTAQRILDYRSQIGGFTNVEQLLEIKGIGAKTLDKIREQVCVR
ncbi:MAG TPA: hypothetical protein DEW10_00865 [Bifidobacterium sp.]|nr:hypothetical protein [Bifidobacterium sp.]